MNLSDKAIIDALTSMRGRRIADFKPLEEVSALTRAIKLLKAEPVEPTIHHVIDGAKTFYTCPRCGREQKYAPNFCYNCGQEFVYPTRFTMEDEDFE